MKEFVFVTARISAPSHSKGRGARRIAQFERGVAEIAIQRAVKMDIKVRLAADIDHAILYGSGSAEPVGLLATVDVPVSFPSGVFPMLNMARNENEDIPEDTHAHNCFNCEGRGVYLCDYIGHI